MDRNRPHFEIRYGSVDKGGWDDWLPVALVGPAEQQAFAVEFLRPPRGRRLNAKIAPELRSELDFYLVQKRESDPWWYMQYHCGTAANAYSSIHWSYVPMTTPHVRAKSGSPKSRPEPTGRGARHAYPEPKRRDLTEDEKRQLRAQLKRGESDIYKLAQEFSCSASQVAGLKAALRR